MTNLCRCCIHGGYFLYCKLTIRACLNYCSSNQGCGSGWILSGSEFREKPGLDTDPPFEKKPELDTEPTYEEKAGYGSYLRKFPVSNPNLKNNLDPNPNIENNPDPKPNPTLFLPKKIIYKSFCSDRIRPTFWNRIRPTHPDPDPKSCFKLIQLFKEIRKRKEMILQKIYEKVLLLW